MHRNAASSVNDASDDDALMALIAARDRAAFGAVIARHAAVLHRIGYRMLNDASEAEDIAQEAMTRLWQYADRWQAGGPGIAAWLHRVAVNACLDRLRRRRPLSDAVAPERIDEAPIADALIDAAQARAGVIACIEALSDRQRAAIVLTYYEDLPNIMAAQAMGMNIKAFESLLHRARQSLAAALRRAGLAAPGEQAA